MNLYPEELREIAHAVEKFKDFVNSQMGYTSIEIEWPESEIKFFVVNKSGDTFGEIAYTDDGEIGFVTND